MKKSNQPVDDAHTASLIAYLENGSPGFTFKPRASFTMFTRLMFRLGARCRHIRDVKTARLGKRFEQRRHYPLGTSK